MNLTENYLISNGYDYYGNAAEDTLVFFVHDKDAPEAEPSGTSSEAITNFDSSQENAPADAEYKRSDLQADEFSESVAKRQPADEK